MAAYDDVRFLGSGETCCVVEFSDAIDMTVNERLQNLRKSLLARGIAGVLEMVPTYRSLAVYHNPLVISRDSLVGAIKKSLEGQKSGGAQKKQVLTMPVCYGGKYGPDLAFVAENAYISEDEVIKRHTGRECYCFMLGFTPGFAYLGGMDESIATPRLANPRSVIPAGSVGIAGKQTGAYPIDSPGGWQLIGRTPLALFNPASAPPTLVEPGEWVRFVSISEDEYVRIHHEVKSGVYRVTRTEAA